MSRPIPFLPDPNKWISTTPTSASSFAHKKSTQQRPLVAFKNAFATPPATTQRRRTHNAQKENDSVKGRTALQKTLSGFLTPPDTEVGIRRGAGADVGSVGRGSPRAKGKEKARPLGASRLRVRADDEDLQQPTRSLVRTGSGRSSSGESFVLLEAAQSPSFPPRASQLAPSSTLTSRPIPSSNLPPPQPPSSSSPSRVSSNSTPPASDPIPESVFALHARLCGQASRADEGSSPWREGGAAVRYPALEAKEKRAAERREAQRAERDANRPDKVREVDERVRELVMSGKKGRGKRLAKLSSDDDPPLNDGEEVGSPTPKKRRIMLGRVEANMIPFSPNRSPVANTRMRKEDSQAMRQSPRRSKVPIAELAPLRAERPAERPKPAPFPLGSPPADHHHTTPIFRQQPTPTPFPLGSPAAHRRQTPSTAEQNQPPFRLDRVFAEISARSESPLRSRTKTPPTESPQLCVTPTKRPSPHHKLTPPKHSTAKKRRYEEVNETLFAFAPRQPTPSPIGTGRDAERIEEKKTRGWKAVEMEPETLLSWSLGGGGGGGIGSLHLEPERGGTESPDVNAEGKRDGGADADENEDLWPEEHEAVSEHRPQPSPVQRQAQGSKPRHAESQSLAASTASHSFPRLLSSPSLRHEQSFARPSIVENEAGVDRTAGARRSRPRRSGEDRWKTLDRGILSVPVDDASAPHCSSSPSSAPSSSRRKRPTSSTAAKGKAKAPDKHPSAASQTKLASYGFFGSGKGKKRSRRASIEEADAPDVDFDDMAPSSFSPVKAAGADKGWGKVPAPPLHPDMKEAGRCELERRRKAEEEEVVTRHANSSSSLSAEAEEETAAREAREWMAGIGNRRSSEFGTLGQEEEDEEGE